MDNFNSRPPLDNSALKSLMDGSLKPNEMAMGFPSHRQPPEQYRLLNFYASSQDDPWFPPGLVAPRNGFPDYSSRPLQEFRQPVDSECDTAPNDSTYGSGHFGPGGPSIENTSIYGGEMAATEASRTEGLMADCHLPSLTEDNIPALEGMHHVPRDVNAPQTSKLQCPSCSANVKTKSELKKHEARHRKPHTCNYEGCNKALTGFGTPNDLARHKRTVHHEAGVDQVFVCHHPPCDKKHKIWPRRDNFRSHLSRVHGVKKDSDNDLSEYCSELQTYSSTARDDLLEGVGTQVAMFSPPPAQTEIQSHGMGLGQKHVGAEHGVLLNELAAPSGGSGEDSVVSPAIDQDQSPSAMDLPGDLQISPEYFLPGIDQRTARAAIAHRYQVSELGSNAEESSEPEQTSESNSDGGSNFDTTSCESGNEDNIPSPPKVCDESLLFMPLHQPVDEDMVKAYLRQLPRPMLKKVIADFQAVITSEGVNTDPVGKGKRNIPCSRCAKSFKLPSELRKHQKRHDRPYGCTYGTCKSRFGSKNDWKRHESKQHPESDTWYCDRSLCARLFKRRKDFQIHLERKHAISDPAVVEDKLERRRVGRHCNPRYWCGFCKQIIELEQEDAPNMWAKRCDHIEGHFTGRGGAIQYDISLWESLEDVDIMPGAILATSDNHPVEAAVAATTSAAAATAASARKATASNDRRRKQGQGPTPEDNRPPKRSKTNLGLDTMWVCCVCQSLNNFKTSSKICYECQHALCEAGCAAEDSSRRAKEMP